MKQIQKGIKLIAFKNADLIYTKMEISCSRKIVYYNPHVLCYHEAKTKKETAL